MKDRAKNYKKPNMLIVTVSSDVGGVDLEIMIKRGGSLTLTLSGGSEDPNKRFELGLPGGLRDQRQWVCEDGEAMRPSRPGEFLEDEQLGEQE